MGLFLVLLSLVSQFLGFDCDFLGDDITQSDDVNGADRTGSGDGSALNRQDVVTGTSVGGKSAKKAKSGDNQVNPDDRDEEPSGDDRLGSGARGSGDKVFDNNVNGKGGKGGKKSKGKGGKLSSTDQASFGGESNDWWPGPSV